MADPSGGNPDLGVIVIYHDAAGDFPAIIYACHPTATPPNYDMNVFKGATVPNQTAVVQGVGVGKFQLRESVAGALLA
jgi:hypothetical protein